MRDPSNLARLVRKPCRKIPSRDQFPDGQRRAITKGRHQRSFVGARGRQREKSVSSLESKVQRRLPMPCSHGWRRDRGCLDQDDYCRQVRGGVLHRGQPSQTGFIQALDVPCGPCGGREHHRGSRSDEIDLACGVHPCERWQPGDVDRTGTALPIRMGYSSMSRRGQLMAGDRRARELDGPQKKPGRPDTRRPASYGSDERDESGRDGE